MFEVSGQYIPKGIQYASHKTFVGDVQTLE